MYPVSNDYKAAMHKKVQANQVSGTVGNTPFTDANILAGSLSITNQCSGSENIDIGQVYIGELNCTFVNLGIERYDWYGKDIKIFFAQQLANGTYENIPLGIYTISEAEFTASGIVVKAYDYIAKLDKSCSSLNTGATAYNLVMKACKKCKVKLETTEEEFNNFVNGNVTFGAYAETDIKTYRDAISWIAQALGCFVTASRTGGILFKTYGSEVVDTIDDKNRFSGCSFSSFSTRYSGMSVVNMEKQTTSYYALDPDNALTYNLGSNPYLQISVSHSLTTMRRNVLNALAKIDYVPFKAVCIGNPAYDLGDVLVFSNGLADGDKKYCITKYTWNYGSGYTMEGVGKNPALANIYSKSDKNIEGLISQTVSDEIFRYTVLRNGESISIADGEAKSVIFTRYLVSNPCHVRFNFEILLTITPTTDGGDAEIKAIYKSDGEEIKDRYPIETWKAGKHILTLQYDLEHDDKLSHSFDLWLEMNGGSVDIAAEGVYEVISSTGLAADDNWEGTFRGEDGNLYIVIDGQAHKIPDSIEVGKTPNITAYEANENINYNGVLIRAVYGDGSTSNITNDCVFNPVNGTPFDPEQDNYIEVSYSIYTVEYGTGFDLFTSQASNIEIVNLPNKIDYKNGEIIDYTGLKVVLNYKDNEQTDITEECEIIPANGTVFNYKDTN